MSYLWLKTVLFGLSLVTVLPCSAAALQWVRISDDGQGFVGTKGRARHKIAQQWIRTLVPGKRKHDKRHLITVGLVPWSLDRPGLTSGFVPERIAEDLDFIAMHLYPEKGKVAEAAETLKGFAAVGKPVVSRMNRGS